MQIYWVNEYYDRYNDRGLSVDGTAFYATRELAEREANKIIDFERNQWERKEKYNAEQFALVEKAKEALTKEGLDYRNLSYASPPTKFKPSVFVDEIDIIVE